MTFFHSLEILKQYLLIETSCKTFEQIFWFKEINLTKISYLCQLRQSRVSIVYFRHVLAFREKDLA